MVKRIEGLVRRQLQATVSSRPAMCLQRCTSLSSGLTTNNSYFVLTTAPGNSRDTDGSVEVLVPPEFEAGFVTLACGMFTRNRSL